MAAAFPVANLQCSSGSQALSTTSTVEKYLSLLGMESQKKAVEEAFAPANANTQHLSLLKAGEIFISQIRSWHCEMPQITFSCSYS